MRIVKAFVLASFAPVVITGGFWVGGFDFDKRGNIAVTCYTLSVVVFLYLFAMVMSVSASE